MSITQSDDPTRRQPLRLWPGAALVILQWLFWLGLPVVAPEAGMFAVLGAVACGLAIGAWWLLFSRAPWVERVGAIALMVVAVVATFRLVHPSIANGMMGMMLPIYAIPVLSLALVGWAVASRGLSTAPRRAAMVASILLACGAFTLIRTGGITGDGASDLHWRWTPTAEERLLAQAGDEPLDSARGEPEPVPSPPAAPGAPEAPRPAPPSEPMAVAAAPSEAIASRAWPGFRGPGRDGVVRGVRIETDWAASPPVELWRRPIGPGWSSFAVHGNLLYTQEQRGDEEIVSAYDLTTGAPVWWHRDEARFWESNAGAGPRATPTVRDGRVYTVGATGIVNALDARTGTLVWSRNGTSDTGAKVPDWGFAGSPLAMDALVFVALSGRLAAYDAATGDPRWFGPAGGGGGYSSPHLATIDEVAQILLLRGGGATSVAPADGTLLWEHAWQQPGGSIVQPGIAEDGGVLITAGDMMGGVGMRRLAVARGPAGWTVEERWTSRGLKPYFNDFVVHQGHAFGFDGRILSCIDLTDGTRQWKGGRYGNGQLILLPEQDLLLVLSEDGELALVRATPDQFTELARRPAIEGKTWNHPVLAGDVLLVRNGQEMAAFRLALAGR